MPATSEEIEFALAAQRESIADMLTAEAVATEEAELRAGRPKGRASGAIHYAAQLVREGATAEDLGLTAPEPTTTEPQTRGPSE